MIRLTLFFIILFSVYPAHAAVLNGMRVGEHPDKIRLVIVLSDTVEFQAKVVSDPNRLSIYLPLHNADNVKNVRLAYPFTEVEYHKMSGDIMRIDMPLAKPHIIRNAFMIAGEAKSAHRLVIDMITASQDEFDQNSTILHGPLDVETKDTTSTDNVQEVTFKPVIMIDAGHGGRDPGAISPRGIKEKDITLSIAKTLASIFNQTGRYDVLLTRDDDRFLKLNDRVKIARQAKADLFISIHADSVGNDRTRGASVYTLSNKASDSQTAMLAARENSADLIGGLDLDVEDKTVSAILIDLSMRETMNRSKGLAGNVVAGLRAGGVETLKGSHRYAGFAVLKAPDIPSILIETGFVSNEDEARTLLNAEHQTQIGEALLQGVDRYFK